jgi:predicted MFS family arabinose efflux permease
LGASLIYLSIVKEIGQLFSARQFPALLGYTFCCGYCGGVAGTIPLERAAHFWGWRHALSGVGVATVAAVALAFAVFRYLPHDSHPVQERSLLRPLLQILRNRLCWPVLVTALINFAIFFVIQTTLGKKFLEDVAHLGSATAALFTSVMMACSAIGVFLAGPLLKLTRERRRTHLVVAAIMIIIAVVAMLAGVWRGAPSWVFLLAYVLLAFSVASSPAAVALMKEYNTPETLALSVGVYNCTAYVGVAVLANLGGVALDSYASESRLTASGRIYPPAAYVSVFVILGVLALVSLVAAFLAQETCGQPLRQTHSSTVS